MRVAHVKGLLTLYKSMSYEMIPLLSLTTVSQTFPEFSFFYQLHISDHSIRMMLAEKAVNNTSASAF